MSREKPAKGIEWDLTEYYSGIDDPQIKKDLEKVKLLVSQFNKKYKGKVNISTLTPQKLLKMLEEFTNIDELADKYSTYSGLRYAKNTLDEDIGAFSQNIREEMTKISSDVLWFGLERKKLSIKKAREMISSKTLSGYKHFLQHERVFVPFDLSEKEEKILNLFSPSGASAFVRLYDQLRSSAQYEIEADGEKKNLSISEVQPYLATHKDRSVRTNAAKAITENLKQNSMQNTLILNTLLLDSKISDEVRGYKYPQEDTFLSDEVKLETVEKMSSVVESSFGICERFYKAKAKAVGLNKLNEWDRYSEIYDVPKLKYSWKEAKHIVLDAFRDFDFQMAQEATVFFEKNWIDAEITPGKRGGAFCSLGSPSEHPHILMNFTGELIDVTTLAHELGHGIHSILSRKQTLFEFIPSTPTAEISSIFAESIVFDKLFQELTEKEAKVNMLAKKLQGIFASVFRQNAFYLFETDLHTHRRDKGELKQEDINNYYQKRLQDMFGRGLKLTDDHKHWWAIVPHFYHYDFYVFSYAFGELLTTSLYARYKEDGDRFKDDYLKALSMGGSKDPYELTEIMGVDINDENFWKNGLDIISGYVDEFEKLVS